VTHASCQHQAYRLTCGDYDALVKRAGNKCEICRTPGIETRRGILCIDHDPRYGYFAVRGLLCDSCNHVMGRVDRGLRHGDARTYEYCQNAWFVGVLKQRYISTPPRPKADKASTDE
jgi:hypothetical protein